MLSQLLNWFSRDISWRNEWMNEQMSFSLVSVPGPHGVFSSLQSILAARYSFCWDPSARNLCGPTWGFHRILVAEDSWGFPGVISHPVLQNPREFTHLILKVCSDWELLTPRLPYITETHSRIHSTGIYGLPTVDQALYWAQRALLELKSL